MDSFSEAWDYVCDYCRERIAEVAYQTWISRIVPIEMDFDSQSAILQVPNEFHKKTIEKCYFTLLKEAFGQIFGSDIRVTLTLPKETPAAKEEESFSESDYDYTFSNFIVGPSNQLAYAAAVAVADHPGLKYNPFLIYGNSGLGKTHLLNAIKNRIRETHPDINIIYIKGDEFTNELIDAIKKGTQAEFRQKYRKADLFLMDDIQFIAGRESTQEEFFHTFNILYEDRKQIVLTSDRPPKDIATLEERIRTRIESDVMADIQPPDFETRVAILSRKAEALDFEIPDNVKEYIADKLKNNIRQLEGAIKRLNAYYLLQGKPPTIALAQSAISDVINNDQPTTVRIEKIIDEVARTYGVTPEEIKSNSRKANVSNARQVAIYAIRTITQITYEAIGKEVGGRDHATIVYSLQQTEKKMEQNPRVKATIDDIIRNIRNM